METPNSKSGKRRGERTHAHPLKYIRVALGAIVLLLFTAIFIDISGRVPFKLHALGHLQLIPAILAGMGGVVVLLLVLTLLLGRVYCSVLCPLGVLQDVIERCARIFRRKKGGRRGTGNGNGGRRVGAKAGSEAWWAGEGVYHKPYNWLRYTFLAIAAIPAALVTVSSAAVATTFPLLVLDPYSNFGRIVTGLFKPVYAWGNNLLASLLNAHGNFVLYAVPQYPSLLVALFAGVVLIVLIVLVAWRGRLWCNTVCPVGTLLGVVSRWSLVRISIDPGACNHCNRCVRACKAECIDQRAGHVDMSRCVACYNCLAECDQAALKYKLVNFKSLKEKCFAPQAVDSNFDHSRRQFLASAAAALVIAPAAALAAKAAGATGEGPRLSLSPARYPLPPGATADFRYRCTACQLCVSRCPMHTLRPANLEHGIAGIMQPHMYFETDVYCNYGCTTCSHVCPTGALLPLTLEQKRTRQAGVVHFVRDECIVQTKHQDCGACAEHCPTGAVYMIPFDQDQSLTIPTTDREVCIGCGGCESICPARPMAIFVVASDPQGTASPPRNSSKGSDDFEGFGF